ncbi:YdeI family protein [Pseudoroseicyclus sp. CXY001]|uniref:YdeI/OmpD-associated family protein n=1 Tax=Pseudoroseicyclus sp. CXY001 TaxID=3242492 RepID=UPI003570ABF8
MTEQAFPSREALFQWLEAHHQSETELWVKIYKVGSGVPSVTWQDCVVAALAWGWIDSQRKPLDEESYLQRLTPRRPRSPWSQKNRAHVDRLIAEGLMSPAGLAHVEAAKADGRWEAAYAGQAEMEIPADFLAALESRPKAKAFFDGLSRSNHFAVYYRLTSAKKPETRARRMEKILGQLERGEKLV